MILLTFILFLEYSSAASTYEPLNPMIIEPDRGAQLPQFIQTGLFEAIRDLQQKISVLKTVSSFIPNKHFVKCSNQSTIYMNAASKAHSWEPYLDFSRGFYLEMNNFAIIIEKDSPVCVSDPLLLASARPCIFNETTRPLLAALNICHGTRWRGFQAVKDLFRHEILHALGYGTVVPTQNHHFSGKPEFYPWLDGTRYQNATRYFMDFASEAKNIVQQHFNCSLIKGVEAEGADKIHLSEYIFGNELMTPKLSNRKNYFTLISATILENTYIGQSRWYEMNHSAIFPEHSEYWFGKGWGCNFVRRSCYDYLRTTKTSFPFCPVHYYKQGIPVEYCMLRNGIRLRATSMCSSVPLQLIKPKANNGIIYSPTETGQNRAPSTELYRYCPMMKDYLEEKLEPNTLFVPCD